MGRGKRALQHGFQNWRESEAGFFTKLRMVGSNNLKKMRTRSDCCGNHGDPGC